MSETSRAGAGAESRRRGRAGERNFLNYLGRQDWIANPASDDDRGTDVVAFLDATGRGQFAALAFQVKTPARVEFKSRRDGSYGYTFHERKKDAGRHYEYWVNHDLPHILIIQTEDESLRLWQSLDRKSVKLTHGGGLSVFIPSTQVVQEDPPQEWLDLASRRASQRFESISRWEAGLGGSIAPRDEVRFALIVPRLVAAHPNQGSRSFSATQALADSVIDGDLWRRYQGRSGLPSPAEALTHHEEYWQLAGALYRSRFTEDESQIARLADGASLPDVRAAARAIAAAVLLGDARPHEALARAVADADFSPEESHWLATLRVSALRAIGERGQLRDEIKNALAATPGLTADPATRQLNAALVWANFKSREDQSADLAAVANAADHAASWWRDRHLSSAFVASTHRIFGEWAKTQRQRFGGDYVHHNQLASASLQASIGGSPDEARRVMSLLGRVDAIAFESDPELLGASLKVLILSGDRDSLRDALRRCLRTAPGQAFDGLVEAAIRALDDVDLVKSGIEALRSLGPYVDESQHDSVKSALLATAYLSGQPARDRITGSDAAERALVAIVNMGTRLSDHETAELVAWVCSRSDDDGFEEKAVNAAARVLDECSSPLQGRLRKNALRATERLGPESPRYWALVAALGRSTRGGGARLAAGLNRRDERAEEFARWVHAFSPVQQRANLDVALAHLSKEREAAPASGVAFGGVDYAGRALQFARELGDRDATSQILEYLSDPKIKPHVKREASIGIADSFDRLPWLDYEATERAALVITQQRDKGGEPLGIVGFDIAGAPERLLLRLPSLDSSRAQSAVARLVGGNDAERRDLAISLAYREGYDLVLVALTKDPTFIVRSAAVAASAYAIIGRESDHELLEPALQLALDETGPEVHRQVRMALEGLAPVDAAASLRKQDLVDRIRDRL